MDGEGPGRVGRETLGVGGRLYIDYEHLLAVARQEGPAEGGASLTRFGRAIEAGWGWLYEQETRGTRDSRAFTVGTFTWLWDATRDIAPQEPENRIIGVYGTSVAPKAARDKSRMAGFPLGSSGAGRRVHRGHAIGHSVGGPDEGFNLFTQDASVNLGREWRSLATARGPGLGVCPRAWRRREVSGSRDLRRRGRRQVVGVRAFRSARRPARPAVPQHCGS